MGNEPCKVSYEVLSATQPGIGRCRRHYDVSCPDKSEAPTPEETKRSQGKIDDGRKWAGYNPAVEARWISDSDLERVRSKVKSSAKMLEGRPAYRGDEKARL